METTFGSVVAGLDEVFDRAVAVVRMMEEQVLLAKLVENVVASPCSDAALRP